MILSDISELKQFSHVKIKVRCDGHLSDKCINEWECKLSEIAIKRKRNNNSIDYCFYCYVIFNRGGTKSHFNKYYKNDLYFSNIDCEDKAYFLGWIAADGHVRRNRFTVKIIATDGDVLEQFSKCLDSNIPVLYKKYENTEYAILDVSSMKMTADLANILNIQFGPKDFVVGFSKLTDELTWHFIRGLFEGDGHIPKITKKGHGIRLTISSCSKNMKQGLYHFLERMGIKSSFNDRTINICGIHAVELIKKMYDNSDEKLTLSRKRKLCLYWREYSPQSKKLDYKKAQEIRKLKLNGVSTKVLCKTFNVGKTTIYYIVNYTSYYKKE